MKEKLFYILLGAALVMAGALLQPRIGTKAVAAPGTPVTQWEYHQEIVEGKENTTVQGDVPYAAPCGFVKSDDGSILPPNTLNKLGDNGWELIGVLDVPLVSKYNYADRYKLSGCQATYVFKRPK